MRLGWGVALAALAIVGGSGPGWTQGGGGGAARAVVYGPEEVEERPMLRSSPTFRYPERLRPLRLQGDVWLEFVVQPDGRVDSTTFVVVSTPDPRLVDEAKRRVLQLQFYPGSISGRPVAVRVRMPITFRLR